MKKTLVVMAHPNIENSRANKAFKEEAEKLSDIELYNIYEKYPDGKIDVEKELKLLSETGTLILQFPLFWFNCPSLLKEWIDTVFMAAHYGENKVLKGKKIGVAVTTGGIASRYDGTNGLTIKEVLKPFLLSIAHVEGIELPIYSLFGVMPDLSDKKIAESSIYNYLEKKLHLKISHSRREIKFRYATEDEKKYMDLKNFDSVVVIESHTYLSNGTLFQYGINSYRPDKFVFSTVAKR